MCKRSAEQCRRGLKFSPLYLCAIAERRAREKFLLRGLYLSIETGVECTRDLNLTGTSEDCGPIQKQAKRA